MKGTEVYVKSYKGEYLSILTNSSSREHIEE
jgi:hypothetical protein